MRLGEIWNDFLREQGESVVDELLSGACRLAVVRGSEVATTTRTPLRRPSTAVAEGSALDPSGTARLLPSLESEDSRRKHLSQVGFTAKQLREVAKHLGVRGYSNLKKERLIDLLVGARGGHDPKADNAARAPEQPPAAGPATDVPEAAAGIAARLRVTETEPEGATYLDEQHLDRAGLLAVAAELQLTRVERLSLKELKRRILKQAIGSRRKFAGLRKW
ncbi:hypothetical protein ABZ805_10310 [Saccharopolyspora sp. NPDC047091]|uniref:hypothetical protein n=1 Tax=Saccharopolyspora sp. NPDC047091 TaxID=3155924 RepID=UPI0033F2D637